MNNYKMDRFFAATALVLGLGMAELAFATDWYVNDADQTLDVYCTAPGNDANDGKSPATPKLSVASVGTSAEFMPGDTLYIDTGTYNLGNNPYVFTRSGTSEARIAVRGSPLGTHLVQGNGEGQVLLVTASRVDFSYLKLEGNVVYNGLQLACSECDFDHVDVLTSPYRGIEMESGCYSNRFHHGIVKGFTQCGVDQYWSGARGNEYYSSTFIGRGRLLSDFSGQAVTRFENNVAKVTSSIFSTRLVEFSFSGNLLHAPQMSTADGLATLADVEALYPDSFKGNTVADPLFVDEAGGDYHLQSPYGYWKAETNENGYVTGGAWVTNAAMGMSPGVDFGYDNEYASWTNEPSPNGGRVNAGAYGGTEEASKGHPDGEKWLYAASFNDGGNLVGSGVFEWRAGGFGDGEKVRLQYTHDGTTWSNIASTVKANAERYEWTVPAGANGAWTKWRVRTTNSTGWIASTNAAAFSIRGADDPSIAYYVNDASTNGDVYCKAVGSDENTGAAPLQPKATLKSVLDTYQLLPGDVVYVDTGVYEDTDGTNVWTTTLSSLDAGTADAPVTVLGAGAGTVFAGTSKSRVVMQVSGDYYDLRDFTVSGGSQGLQVTGNTNHIQGVWATNNVQGVVVSGTGNRLERIAAWKNSQYGVSATDGGGTVLDHSVLWENGTAAANGTAARLEVRNSILGGEGYAFVGDTIPAGDYNVVSVPAISSTRADLASLLAVASSNSWTHTVARDPQFADAENGDFHLSAGSPAIDAGDPDADCSQEPAPNGGRLNVGLYGNTEEAATSATGAWLQLLSFVDGGTLDASVTNVIRWNAGNLPEGATLTLWLKRSAGGAWEALETGLDAASGEYEYWKAVEENTSSLSAYLKLTLDGNEKVSSETETAMTYRDGAFPYYVNDASTDGDVYCNAPGSEDGDGLSPDTPVLSLEALMAKYPQFTAGDTIYVDTGSYTTNRTAWAIKDNMPGTAEKPIRIIGSSNAEAGGSVIGNRQNRHPVGMAIGAGAKYLKISNLTFTNVNGNAVTVSNAPHVTLEGIQVRGATGTGIGVLGKAEDVAVAHSAATGCGIGLELGECTDAVVEHCVFADNAVGVKAAANSVATLENSALSASSDGAVLYQVAGTAFQADYNGLHAGGNARVSAQADNVHAWQSASGLDAHGVPGDPLFGDAANFDYHLMTKRTLGRWLPNGQRTTDEENSPLLAAGRPEEDGTRPNIGMHGGTERASLPPAGEWLRAVSFNDAGGVGDETVALQWVAGAAMAGQTVKVEVSGDGGQTWTAVQTNVEASSGTADWAAGTAADTPAGLWRVTSEADEGVSGACDAFFAVRKAPLSIYVAPATVNTNEATYVTGVGSADNWTATKDKPIDSLATVLDAFDLEGGDTVYVERGTYAGETGMAMGVKQSGTAGDAVRIVGAADKPFDGTVVALASRGYGSVLLDLQGASNVRVEALTLSNAWTGVQAGKATGIEFDRVRITHMATNAVNAQSGAVLTLAHSVVDDSVYGGVCVNTGAVVNVVHGYLAASSRLPLVLRGGNARVTNSVMAASGLGRSVYTWQSGSGGVVADYNDIRAENGANISAGTGRESHRFLNEWQGATGNDMHSVGYDPMMADEGKNDYHLASAAGRYDPAAGTHVTTDSETSRLIDLGAPTMDWGQEPTPNGGRSNIGVFGGTSEASMSAATNFIAPLTMSDGGTIRGEVDLYWTYSTNYVGNERVNVLLSVDGGETWQSIQNNVYLNAGMVTWNSTNAISTGQGVWKVELASDTNVFGRTETLFAIKNDPLVYYVNDGSTNGDVYCTAKGTATGSGTEPGEPMDSLSRLLGKYKLEAGDKVYVDTGVYEETGGVVFSAAFGVATNWLTIQGSTNRAAGGTVITNSSSSPVIDLQGMGSVELRDLTLTGGDRGVLLSGATSNRLWRVASVGARAAAFDIAPNSGGNFFDECAAVGFACTGLVQRTASGQSAFTGTNEWNGGIFITKGMSTNGTPLATGTVVHATSGRLTVQNSVFALNGSLDTALVGTASSLTSDHNDYWLAQDGALLARWNVSPAPTYGVREQAVDTLSAWRTLSGLDGESFSADPLFADAENLDFHPKSEGGRYYARMDEWVEDKETSPLIGTGSEDGDVRRGVGWYGGIGDGEASKTPGPLSLVPLDFADGGVADGDVELRWIARGSNLSETVTARYILANGVRGDIGTVAASTGCVTWASTSLGSDGAVRWGFGKDSDFSDVEAARPFTLHNGAMTYYINDDSTDGDVYCSAAGSSGNTGLSTNSPLDSLSELLRRYDLEPGDTVLMDAGTYESGMVAVDWRDSGTADARVTFKGAPHAKTKVLGGLRLANASGVEVVDLSFNSAGVRNNTLSVQNAEAIGFDGVDVLGSDWSAMSVSCSTNVAGSHMILANAKTNGLVCEASFGANFNFMTVCSNAAAQIVTRRQAASGGGDTNRHNAFMSLSNSIVVAKGDRVPIYDVYGTVYADHNDLHTEGGALVALMHEGQIAKELRSVNAWYNERGQDAFSLSHDPSFVDGRNGDFHLTSPAGRFDPAQGVFVTNGTERAAVPIDAGDATMAVADEPSPNGGRVNLGRYGGTDEASKTPEDGGLTLIALHDGGRASGTNFPVTWIARGDTADATLDILYIDGGTTNVLATVSAAEGAWYWDTTSTTPSVQGKIKLVASDGSEAQSEAFFSVRNPGDTFKFYVNDGSRSGDVYCNAAGSNTGDGLTPDTPMLDLNQLLETYKLESGDTVLVDTGRYATGASPWRITQDDSAEELGVAPVTIQGSTNSLYGGTVLARNGAENGVVVDYAIGLAIRNITVSNTSSVAIALNSSYETSLEWVTVGNANAGIQVAGGSAAKISHCVLHDLVSGVGVGGTVATNTVFPVLEHSVIWKPAGTAVSVSGNYKLTAKHNVFAPTADQYVYALDRLATLNADYNAFAMETDARISRRQRTGEAKPIIYETVGAWVTASGQDGHSYDGDAFFADADDLDFHLASRAGRWNGTEFITSDDVTSPLVDAGDPEASVGEEEEPNGGRVNIGLYGGTKEASKSDSDGRFNLLTYNNGGVAAGRVALNWNALGAAEGTTVRIEVSLDGGETWPVTVGEGIEATVGGVLWNSAEQGSSALAKWRLVDEGGAWPTAESVQPFILHNQGLAYYVNDDTAEPGDYCTAAGSSDNDGLTPATPKRWLSEILDTYNLEPGDVVYVDSGVYQPGGTETIGDLDAGEYGGADGTRVTIQGQTNANAEATLYVTSDPELDFLKLDGTCGIKLSHMQFLGASNAVVLSDSVDVDAEWLRAKDGWRGIAMGNSSSNVWIRHSVFQGNADAGVYFDGAQTRRAAVEHSVLWSNRYGVYVDQGTVSVSNSVVGVCDDGAFAYYGRKDRPVCNLFGDYNDLYLERGGMAGLQSGSGSNARTSLYTRVSAWNTAMGQEGHSLVQDPLFVDAQGGDFHLKSVGGHWNAAKGWVLTDGVTSPLIDSGSRSSQEWVNEPTPNGRRVNIGLHGGTEEASKTPEAGWITALSLVDGGSASGIIELRWQAGGAATNDDVRIEFSYDGGATWSRTIVDDYPAVLGSFEWDSTEWGATAQAMWRIMSQRDGTIMDGSMVPFVLRNGGSIAYYVNDIYEEGDTYCTVDGDDANDGLTPETPKASLQAIFDAYELAPEDVVYVDAGIYTAGSPAIVIDGGDSGWTNENLYVTVQGSTNPVARTVFTAPFGSPCAFELSYAENVKIRDISIQNAQVGVKMTHTIGCVLENVRLEKNMQAGLSLDYAEKTLVDHGIFWNNLTTTSGVAVAIGQGDLALNHCVLWGSWTAIDLGQAGALSVSNSVLDARGADGRIYSAPITVNVTNMLSADYNAYSCRDGALIAEQAYLVGGSDYYGDLPKWYAASGQDGHSRKGDPAFVNPSQGDFHLQSLEGRFTTNGWWETTNHWTYSWTNSMLLAAGDPAADASAQPAPNAGVVNIGAYGGTPEASKCSTNPPWVQAMALNEKCVVSAPVKLHWTYGGVPEGVTVRLEYSTRHWELDSGMVIASNIPISAREYDWDITADVPLALELQWRVVPENMPELAEDKSDAYVSVKTQTYSYYVNDGSTDGDVFCTAPGGAWSGEADAGRTNSMPFDSLKTLMETYPVGAGDVIYADTGVYDLGAAGAVFGGDQSGMEGMPFTIVGSTNGSVFTSTTNGFLFMNMRQVVVSNLTVEGASLSGFRLQNVSDVELAGIRSVGNGLHGVDIANGANVDIHHAVLADNAGYGIYSAGNSAGGRTVGNATLANNARGALYTDMDMGLDNSIVSGTNSVPLVQLPSQNSKLSGDYNLYWTTASNGVFATNAYKKLAYANLKQWQTEEEMDMHSLRVDPLFADAAGGDYHPMSRQGRWNGTGWVTDGDTSWAIDAADPDADYAREPDPNGKRRNLGAYGGTGEASKSDPTVKELSVGSLRDGGVATIGQLLLWAGRGLDATNAVRLEYSAGPGQEWKTITTSTVGEGATGYVWPGMGEEWTPSPLAQWRVVLATDTNVVGQTPTNFVYRPTPLVYYVNDLSTEGDMYTTDVGDPANNGYQTNSPLDSVASVLERYQLTPGDSLLIDAGEYELAEPIEWTSFNAGTEAEPVVIQGSTDPTAPTTLVAAETMDRPAFSFIPTHDVTLRHLGLLGFTNGVAIPKDNTRITLENLDIQRSWGPAVSVQQANGTVLRRVLMRDGDGVGLSAGQCKVYLDSCVVWSNASHAVSMGTGVELSMTNSVLGATGFGQYCYYSATNAVVKADYNDLHLANAAQIASINGVQYERHPQWMKGFNTDIHSLSTDPLFHDPANGDFHPRSRAGRYDPATKTMVNDEAEPGVADFSPLIDMGHTNFDWSAETAPNGGRRNIGLYGGTAEASRSDTNAWVMAVTAMSGGLLDGTFFLSWGYGGDLDPKAPVRLEYSPYNGKGEWTYIATSTVGAGAYYWASDAKNASGGEKWLTSPEARWRLVVVDNTNVWDTTESPFGLRNQPFKYYLNDGGTNGDLWCSVVGDDAHSGFWPDAPKATLQSLLEDIDVEPTDEILMDTGVYLMDDTNRPVAWLASDGGAAGQPVKWIGSTNGAAIRIENNFAGGSLFDSAADYVTASDIGFEVAAPNAQSVGFAGTGLQLTGLSFSNATLALNSTASRYDGMTVDGGSVSLSGLSNRVSRMESRFAPLTLVGTNAMLQNSVVYVTNAARTAVVVRASGASLTNCTVVAPRGTAVGKTGGGTLRLEGNILVAGGGRGNAVLDWHSGGLVSDWNDFHTLDPLTWVGINGDTKWEKLAYWQKSSGKDAHSVSFDPAFADMDAGDFHLMSKAERGRWSPARGDWVQDDIHSPLIDMGNPSLGTGNEIMPNGYRPNLGAYGGTEQASKSVTNFWVQALTQNDGGVLTGGTVTLRWAANQMNEWNDKMVNLSYSPDGGATWTAIATGVSAQSGSYAWNTEGVADSFNALWRVEDASDPDVADASDEPFALRNAPADFYLSGDDGDDAADGLQPETPMKTFQALLDRYDLEGGDTVHAAAGDYTSETNVFVIWSRSGTEGNPVKIDGELTADGMAGVRLGVGNPSVEIRASHVDWSGLDLTGLSSSSNQTVGVSLVNNKGITLRNIDAAHLRAGVSANGAEGTTVLNSSFLGVAAGVDLYNSRSNVLRNLTFANIPTGGAGVKLRQSDANTLENNIFVPGEGAHAYDIASGISMLKEGTMDYNLYDFGAEGSGFHEGSTNVLRRWQLWTDRDYRSEMGDAKLHNADVRDFHPSSPYGRLKDGSFVETDSDLSFAVDHGNPALDVGDEEETNGGRINIGRFGGTAYASKGGTNVAFGLRTLNEGESVSSGDATWPLVWEAHLVPGNPTVYVQYANSPDFANATNIAVCKAYDEYVVWTVRDETATGYWRVITEDGSLLAATDKPFSYILSEFGISRPPYMVHGLMRFDWKGGRAGTHYKIQYSDDFGGSWHDWPKAYNGPEKKHRSNFVMQPGETLEQEPDDPKDPDKGSHFTFEDITSFGKTQRWYRFDPELEY